MRSRFCDLNIVFALVVCAVGCQTTPSQFQLKFDQDVNILSENIQERHVKSGESVTLPVSPITITATNHKSVVLIPVGQNQGDYKIRLPKESPGGVDGKNGDGKLTDEQNQRLMGRDANEVTQAIVEIQALLTERRADEALVKIRFLRNRFPLFTYITFLEASCFLIKNDIKKAKVLVEIAMKDFPNDTIGLQFLQEIDRRTKNTDSSDKQEQGNEK